MSWHGSDRGARSGTLICNAFTTVRGSYTWSLSIIVNLEVFLVMPGVSHFLRVNIGIYQFVPLTGINQVFTDTLPTLVSNAFFGKQNCKHRVNLFVLDFDLVRPIPLIA